MNSTNKHRKSLSREDIPNYLSSKDERLKHSIEQQSLENDFDADALEGWKSTNTPIQSMKRLDKKFMPKSNFFLLLSIAAGILIFSVAFFISRENPSSPSIAEASNESVQITFEKTDVTIPEEIDSLEPLPKKQSIRPTAIKEEFKEKVSTQENIDLTKKNIASELNISNIPLIKIDRPNIPKVVTNFTAKEIYLSDLKLVDYRAYRSRPSIKTETMTLSGTPASMEASSSNIEETEWKTSDVPYIDYLKKTQELFSRENYKKALTRYLTILETYPDDVNALFYSGLCYYNLKQYSDASLQFFGCLSSKYNNFNEEAEWFVAKSYQAEGETSKAASIFEMIVEKDGYYAGQAREQLRK